MTAVETFAKLTKDEISNHLEDIFKLTLKENGSSRYDFMKDVSRMLKTDQLDMEHLSKVLFEKILSRPLRSQIIRYLFECYERALVYENKMILDTKRIFEAIFQNVTVCIIQPELIEDADIVEQFFSIITAASYNLDNFERFFNGVCRKFLDDAEYDSQLNEFLHALLNDKMNNYLKNDNSIGCEKCVIEFLEWFAKSEFLAKRFWVSVTPSTENCKGNEFGASILGCLLQISVLKDSHPQQQQQQQVEYFDKPFDERSNISNQEGIWVRNNILIENVHNLLMRFIRMSENIRNRVLNWIAKCIKANESKSKIWNNFLLNAGYHNAELCSDGFMMNLLQVLLRICQPFCNELNILKVLKVDPTYCCLSETEINEKNLHISLIKETCFVPMTSTDDETAANSVQRPRAETYNFITECFFITHKAIQCSFSAVSMRLNYLNEELIKLQDMYSEARSSNRDQHFTETIRHQLVHELRKFLTVRTVLTNSNFIMDFSNLMGASCFWLCQVAINCSIDAESKCFAPLVQRIINLPISHPPPVTLSCVPESVAENIVGFFIFVRRFSSQIFEDMGFLLLDPALTMILIYMGSSSFMRNPHLRAKFAETVAVFLPFNTDMFPNSDKEVYFQREKLFAEHPFRLHIVKSILEVFVSIETTGQSVDFEQKFNYRRPMYQVMKFLWEKPNHNQCFVKLAEDAQKQMMDVQPPLFLRFVNLLMNDAVFLLDEALSNLSKIRLLEIERESGQWNSISADEVREKQENLRVSGLKAKFLNLLSKDTISMLVMLTSKIHVVFTHATMVDRIASTLNFFLLNLVGPNKRNFKVKDASLFNFNPAEMVLNICRIYIHLKESDLFCLAISQDGRSYTPQLFSYAEDVLCRISGGGFYVTEMEQLNDRVLRLARKRKREEEILIDVPEEFLDPIMSTVMTDPVMLPSSRQIVDRNTIARHLLSDQTDPFNRSVLTMDQLVPETELKQRIEQWIREKELAFPESRSAT